MADLDDILTHACVRMFMEEKDVRTQANGGASGDGSVRRAGNILSLDWTGAPLRSLVTVAAAFAVVSALALGLTLYMTSSENPFMKLFQFEKPLDGETVDKSKVLESLEYDPQTSSMAEKDKLQILEGMRAEGGVKTSGSSVPGASSMNKKDKLHVLRSLSQ